MNIFLLGGAGFIGTNLALFLHLAGHNIIVIDKNEVDISRFDNIIPKKNFVKAEFHDTEILKKLFKQIQPDVVIHLISSLIPDTTLQNTIDDINENIVNTLKLLHLMQECNAKKIVFFSSGGVVYGNNQRIINREDDVTYPINTYGWTKLCIEHLIRLHSFKSGTEYIILRPSNVYGKYQNIFGRQGLIAISIGKIVEEKGIDVWGDGSNIRDYVYIDDVCQIVAKLIESDGWNEIYNIGTGKGLSINAILEKVMLTTGKSVPVRYLPERIVDVPANILNNSKVLSKINGFNFTEVELGISIMWEWVKERYNL